jgi:hypothetical protein
MCKILGSIPSTTPKVVTVLSKGNKTFKTNKGILGLNFPTSLLSYMLISEYDVMKFCLLWKLVYFTPCPHPKIKIELIMCEPLENN